MSGGSAPTGVDADLRARVADAVREHERTWGLVFGGDHLDARIEDLCARFVAEEQDIVAHAEDPKRYDERERAALAWAQAIIWSPDTAGDELWARLRAHFDEPQLVTLGTFIALAMGRRNWLRTLPAGG